MTKRLSIAVTLLSGIFVFSSDGLAQRKVVESSAIYEAQRKGWEKLGDRPRSVETVDEVLSGDSTSKTTTVYQFLSPNRSRFYWKKEAAGKTEESESITIDHYRYERKNGGPWSKIDLRTSGGSGMGSGTGTGSTACWQTTQESVVLNGAMTQLFEKITVQNSQNGLSFDEQRSWFGDDGSLLREEMVYGMLSPRVENRRKTTVYEYEPSIKIEAPIP